MAWPDFVAKIERIQQEKSSNIALMLNPRPFLLPHPVQRYDDPYLPFGKAVISATRNIVCAYIFDLGAYLGIGAAGAVAMERTVAYAAQDSVTILHAPFTGQGFSAAADTTGFGVDAITITRAEDMAHYLKNPPGAAFLLTQDDAVPDEGGILVESAGRMLLRGTSGTVQLRMTGDEVLYADGSDNFADKIRAAVEQMR